MCSGTDLEKREKQKEVEKPLGCLDADYPRSRLPVAIQGVGTAEGLNVSVKPGLSVLSANGEAGDILTLSSTECCG